MLSKLDALTGHIKLIIADRDEIPPPSSLEIVLKDPDYQDAIALRLPSADRFFSD